MKSERGRKGLTYEKGNYIILVHLISSCRVWKGFYSCHRATIHCNQCVTVSNGTTYSFPNGHLYTNSCAHDAGYYRDHQSIWPAFY